MLEHFLSFKVSTYLLILIMLIIIIFIVIVFILLLLNLVVQVMQCFLMTLTVM